MTFSYVGTTGLLLTHGCELVYSKTPLGTKSHIFQIIFHPDSDSFRVFSSGFISSGYFSSHNRKTRVSDLSVRERSVTGAACLISLMSVCLSAEQVTTSLEACVSVETADWMSVFAVIEVCSKCSIGAGVVFCDVMKAKRWQQQNSGEAVKKQLVLQTE